jgi:hypothetical protein
MIRACLLALTLATTAAAQDAACVARVNHQDIVLAPGVITADPDLTLRERWLSLPGQAWNGLWGTPAPCDSATTLAFLTGVLGYAETDGFCLAEEDSEGFLLVPGEANFRGRCRRTVCDRVNGTAADIGALTRAVTGVMTGQRVETGADGVRAVTQGAGAMILTGQGSALVEALGSAGTTVGAALSTPGVATAAAVTVVAVGAAVYVCAE